MTRRILTPAVARSAVAVEEVAQRLHQFPFKALYWKLFGIAFGADLGFSALVTLGYLRLFVPDASLHPVALKGILVGIVIRTIIWVSVLLKVLRPTFRLQQETAKPSAHFDYVLLAAARNGYRGPLLFTGVYSVLWGTFYFFVTAWLLVFMSDVIPLSPKAIVGGAMFSATLGTGALTIVLPMSEYLLSRLTGAVSVALHERGLTVPVRMFTFRRRFALLALCFALSPIGRMAAISYMRDLRSGMRDARNQAQMVVSNLARDIEARATTRPLSRDEISDIVASRTLQRVTPFIASVGEAAPAGSPAAALLSTAPSLQRWYLETSALTSGGTSSDLRVECAIAFEKIRNDLIAAAVVTTDPASATEGIVTVLLFLVVTALWAPLAAFFIAGNVGGPVERIASSFAEIIREHGSVSKVRRIPVYFKDEIGLLAEGANEMIDKLKHSHTRIQSYTDELEQKNKQLAEASKLKSQFLASMSHELRTPLNAILGFSRILARKAKDKLDERQRKNVDLIHSSGQALLVLVNDLLDFERIESGQLNVRVSEMSCEDLADQLTATHKPLAEKKGLTIDIGVERPPLRIKTDPDRFRQILVNLVDNAIKYSEKGHIEVRFGRHPPEDPRELRVVVRDQGVGIPEAQLDRIFDPFHQVGDATPGTRSGVGLGLAICRRLSRLLGGSLEVKSEVGVGSTFTLMLRGEFSNEWAVQTAEVTMPPAGQGPLVLVVDDEIAMLELIRTELTDGGFRVHVAANGEIALRKARLIKPDVIVLDIVMPGMDGWQVMRELHSNPETAQIPVVVSSVLDDVPFGVDLGIAAWLTKPIDPSAFRRTVEPILREAAEDVLVVEDDEATRLLIQEELRALRVRVRTAEDGESAIDALHDRIPKLLILDLLLPSIDGFEVLDRLRKMEGGDSVQVVVYTGKELTEVEQDKLRQGLAKVVYKEGEEGVKKLVGSIQTALRTKTPLPG